MYIDNPQSEYWQKTYKKNKKLDFTKTFFIFVKILIFISIVTICAQLVSYFIIYMNKKTDNITNNISKKIESNDAPEWNLSPLYKSTNDSQIQKDINDINEIVDNLESKYKNVNFEFIDQNTLLDVIKFDNTLTEKTGSLGIYAYLLFAKNSNDKDIVQFYSKISELQTEWSAKLSFLKYKIFDINENHLQNIYRTNSEILFYKSYLSDIRKFKNYSLEPIVSKYDIEKSIANSTAVVKYYDQLLTNIKIKFNRKTITLNEAIQLTNSSDRKVRLKVGSLINKALEEKSDAFVFIVNSLVKDKEVRDKWSNYRSPVHKELIANSINEKILKEMVHAVKSNYKNTSHRYYKLKKQIMKIKNFDYVDRNAPLDLNIKDANNDYSWNEVVDLVVDGYSSFSPLMGKYAQWFIDNKRVDAKMTVGKRSGAFCMSMRPFVLMNFHGKIDDIRTLAHEIGHGIQMKLSYEKYGALMSDSPLILAEIPSTFGEALISEKIFQNIQDKNLKIKLLSEKIENALNTITRQIAFHLFEEEVHRLRKERELTKDDLNSIWIKISQEQLGKDVIMDEKYGFYWAYISHFFHHPFYVHSYAFADLTTFALLNLKKKNPNDFEKRYINFITDITVKDYTSLLAEFDLNPNDEYFWKNSIEYVVDLIDQLETLL